MVQSGKDRAPTRAAWLILMSLGCGSDAPPASPLPPPFDAGLDAGDAGSDGSTPNRPDGGPRLPGVDAKVTLPFLGEAQTVEIEIEASLRALDVHFSVDTTASFGDEISVLQRDLSDQVVPELRRRVEDVSVGVSSFEDFPRTPFGTEGDDPFELQTAITSDLRRVDSALAGLDRPIGNGGDGPEAGAEALYQVATGEGYRLANRWTIRPYVREALVGGGTLGGVGYRVGALHALVHITDAPSHTPADYEPGIPDTRSMTQAASALNALNIRALGIVSHPIARDEMERLAIATGAVVEPTSGECLTGIDGESRPPIEDQCPLVFEVHEDGRGLSDTLTDAIVALVDAVELQRAYTEIDDDPLGFVNAVEALEAEVERGATQPERLDERPSDGINDTFVNVRPGTTLRFAVHLRNTLLAPDDAPQFYTVTINLLGDGLSLGTRTIRVEVPARSAMAVPDASVDGGAQDGDAGM